jgi:hypothetical protein
MILMGGKFLSHVFFNVKEKLTARRRANQRDAGPGKARSKFCKSLEVCR